MAVHFVYVGAGKRGNRDVLARVTVVNRFGQELLDSLSKSR